MERLTKRVTNLATSAVNQIGYHYIQFDDLDEAMEKLSHYEDLEEQGELIDKKWIPCSERLPEDFVNVLTCDKKGNIHIMNHNQDAKYPFNISKNHARYYPVVAWMPLPEPYKSE